MFQPRPSHSRPRGIRLAVSNTFKTTYVAYRPSPARHKCLFGRRSLPAILPARWPGFPARPSDGFLELRVGLGRPTNVLMPRWTLACFAAVVLTGCGTTRWTDTSRTATEQMLISDAVDRAISQIDFTALEGRDVYLDARFIFGSVDDRYIISTLRQHMLASGCVIKDKPEDATYIVEVRTGAVGTNRNDLLFGTPATQLPSVGGAAPVSGAAIPEIALFKRTSQQGVCKVAVFAYDRLSGSPVWQSGTRRVDSKSRDVWVLGAGPFQSGSIYNGTKLSGEKLHVPLADSGGPRDGQPPEKADKVWVAHEIVFGKLPAKNIAGAPAPANSPNSTKQASFAGPVTPSLGPSPPAAGSIPTSPQMVPPTPAPRAPASFPNGTSTTQPQPNPTAATIGAIQAYDWAKSFRGEQK